jgi:4-hydroxy-tetrahydrodipicolinate synthase
MESEGISGVFAPIPTPFTESGELDENALKTLIRRYEKAGIDGLLILGTSGEFVMLTEEEKREVIDVVIGTRKRLQIVVNTGTPSTKTTIELTEYARDAGVDAALVVAPYYYRFSAEGIISHFTSVAERVEMPVIVYNIPGFTGNALNSDIVHKISKESYICGIKDSSGDPLLLSEFIEVSSDNFTVFCGWDPLISYALHLGAKGIMVASAVIAPELCLKMFKAAERKEWERVANYQRRINCIARAIFTGTFPTGLKYSLRLLGFPGGYSRMPIELLTYREKEKIKIELEKAGILQK